MPAHTASPAEGPRRRGAALRHLASFVRATTGAVAATATGYGMLSVLAALVGDHDLIYLRHLLDLGILPTGILTGAIACVLGSEEDGMKTGIVVGATVGLCVVLWQGLQAAMLAPALGAAGAVMGSLSGSLMGAIRPAP